MSERTSLAPEIDVDGIDTPKGATLIGKATLNKELGKYVCLANVGGALCVVELNIPVDTAPAAPAPAYCAGCAERDAMLRSANGQFKAAMERAQQVIEQAARLMHGEGVEDQAEAWDKALRLLDAAREGK